MPLSEWSIREQDGHEKFVMQAEYDQTAPGDSGNCASNIEELQPTSNGQDNRIRCRVSSFSRMCHTALPFAIWILCTGWWISSLILHHHDKPWVVPFLLWLSVSLWTIGRLLPNEPFSKPFGWIDNHLWSHFTNLVPRKVRVSMGAVITLIVIVTVTFVPRESGQNTRTNRALSLIGLCSIVFGLWITSHDRRRVQWRRIIVGLQMQFVIAIFVLRTSAGYDSFDFISTLAQHLLGFASDGVAFLTDHNESQLGWFLVEVTPPIIFFVALVQLLYHYGLLQYLLSRIAVIFSWSMNASGAEAIAAAASPFVGQGENAALIGPFMSYLTRAEIHQVMCSGFGTIAGSVLGAYIGLGVNPRLLVSSCAMSIPASLAFSHLRYPPDTQPLTDWRPRAPQNHEQKAANGLHAFTKGAWLGLKVASMIVTIILCIIAMLALVNSLLTWFGSYLNLSGDYDLTVELIVGYACYPIAFLLGIPRNHELLLVGRLIGTKIVANEFVAYQALVSQPQYMILSQRSTYIVSYALCGFGNIAAVGSQIAVLSQIAPERSNDISQLATSALVTGILSTLSSACVAGMLITEH